MTEKLLQHSGSVVFVITAPFQTRDLMSQPLFEKLLGVAGAHGLHAVFSSNEASIAGFVEGHGARFRLLELPSSNLVAKVRLAARGRYLHRASVYRHNEIHRFTHQERFKRITRTFGRSEHSALRPHDVWPAYLGMPFPTSRIMLRAVVGALRSGLISSSSQIRHLFMEERPAALIICGIQSPLSYGYLRYARRYRVPVVGVIGSWDHLTKDGPVPPGIAECWVWNEIMRQEALQHHELQDEQIAVLGAVQFDKYRREPSLADHDDLDRLLQLNRQCRVFTFAANVRQRGWGEPSIADHLARRISEGAYGTERIMLVIRSHPFDTQFEKRFGKLRSHPNVRLWSSAQVKRSDPQDMRTDSRMMNCLLRRSDLLICGQGTPAIDAACVDRPIINLGFSGTDEVPYELSVRYRYEVDHYKKLMATGGSTLVESFEQLDSAVRAYRADPSLHAVGRERIRREFAGITDDRLASGKTAERLDMLLTHQANARGLIEQNRIH